MKTWLPIQGVQNQIGEMVEERLKNGMTIRDPILSAYNKDQSPILHAQIMNQIVSGNWPLIKYEGRGAFIYGPSVSAIASLWIKGGKSIMPCYRDIPERIFTGSNVNAQAAYISILSDKRVLIPTTLVGQCINENREYVDTLIKHNKLVKRTVGTRPRAHQNYITQEDLIQYIVTEKSGMVGSNNYIAGPIVSTQISIQFINSSITQGVVKEIYRIP